MMNRLLLNASLPVLAGVTLLICCGTSAGQILPPGQLVVPGYNGRLYDTYSVVNPPPGGNWYWPNAHWPSCDCFFTYGKPQEADYRVIPPMQPLSPVPAVVPQIDLTRPSPP